MNKERRLGKRHEGRKAKHKVFVATPAYDGKVDTDYAMSLAESSMHAFSQDIVVYSQVMGNGAFIEMARNIFIKNFLDTDADYLFYIDGDLKWESRAFVGLVQAERPVAAGIYRRRQEPEDYPVHYVEDPDRPGIQLADGGWIKCDRVPAGFLCIQRHVVEALAEDAEKVTIANHGLVPWVFDTKFQRDDEIKFVGEDFVFSDKYCQKFDTHIDVWPDFDFVHGGYPCNWHTFMNKQVEKWEQDNEPINLIRKEVAQ